MTRRLLAPLLLLALALTGCGLRTSATPQTDPTPSSAAVCRPTPGGRCAADVAWQGTMQVSSDGRMLHEVVPCGGRLQATETPETVTLTLHVGTMGPGTRSCARVDVGVRLAAPLGDRTVVDGVSGRQLRVEQPL